MQGLRSERAMFTIQRWNGQIREGRAPEGHRPVMLCKERTQACLAGRRIANVKPV